MSLPIGTKNSADHKLMLEQLGVVVRQHRMVISILLQDIHQLQKPSLLPRSMPERIKTIHKHYNRYWAEEVFSQTELDALLEDMEQD